MTTPAARRERGPEGYAFPTSDEHLLAWGEAERRLAAARHYWLATTNPDGTAHVRPVWGVWVKGCLYFDGHPQTRWARNLARESRASIHLDDAANVLIVEGLGEDIERTDEELGRQISDGWNAKYGRLAPEPATGGIFRLTPSQARAWSEDLHDATVWTLTQ
jgi:Pyridoxamine 5'-phosphate oxidase